MAYPPPLPALGKVNSTPQNNDHPAHHNALAQAIRDIVDILGESPADGASDMSVRGGVTMQVSFADLPDGPLTRSNGDGPEDPSLFTDVSGFAGGIPGLLAVRNGEFRIDASLASGEADCRAVVIQGDPITATVDRSFYEDGVRMVFGFGPAHIPLDATWQSGVLTYIGFLLTDSTGAGWQFEMQAKNVGGQLKTRQALFPTIDYGPVYGSPLYDSGDLDGNFTAGVFWIDHMSDGRWAFHRVGTEKAVGTGLFDQNDTTLLAFIAGQSGLVDDTPVPDLWVPMSGWATVQPGVKFYSFGASSNRGLARVVHIEAQDSWDQGYTDRVLVVDPTGATGDTSINLISPSEAEGLTTIVRRVNDSDPDDVLVVGTINDVPSATITLSAGQSVRLTSDGETWFEN